MSGKWNKPTSSNLSALPASLPLQHICGTKQEVLYTAPSSSPTHRREHTCTQTERLGQKCSGIFPLHLVLKVKNWPHFYSEFLFLNWFFFLFSLSLMAHMSKIKWTEIKLGETQLNGLSLAVVPLLKFKSGLSFLLIYNRGKKTAGF